MALAPSLTYRLVDAYLVGYVHADDRRSDDFVHVLHGVQYTFTQIAALVAVAQLQRLVFAGRSTARNGGTTERARLGADFDLDGRIAARVENLAGVYFDDFHGDVHRIHSV